MTHHVVTLHSNPCRYERPEANYWTFREGLPDGVTLHTMELSFDGRFVIPDAVQVAGGHEHMLWQKEAAMRWLIRNVVPRDADVVTWCDADAVFENADCFDHAAELIRSGRYEVVQPYGICRRLSADGSTERDQVAWAAVHVGDAPEDTKRPAPGLAWTAPREIAERIFVRDCGGGGDHSQAMMWAGRFGDSRFRSQNPAWRQGIFRRGVWHYRRVRGRIGYVEGVARHLWHGSSENRQYGKRQTAMTENAYDPDGDVEIDAANGLLRWSSNKPALHQYMREFFHKRREDG